MYYQLALLVSMLELKVKGTAENKNNKIVKAAIC
jgi:hypothetical protein